MLFDLTLRITPKMVSGAEGNEKRAVVGHLGTHFDVMDKDFPLEYTERKGIVFDVQKVAGRDIGITDIAINRVGKDMFVAFYTGTTETKEYGTKDYFTGHPQLSNGLIDELVNRKVSIIGVDCAGARRGPEHPLTDKRLAGLGIFVIENLYGFAALLKTADEFTACTYPMSYAEMSGLPCRVVARV